jgi:predicted phage terminase large subunit-like protein
VAWLAWTWSWDPQARLCFVGGEEKIVLRNLGVFRAIIQSDEFVRLYGQLLDGPTIIDQIMNTQGGMMMGTTRGGRVIGYHFDHIVCDDLAKGTDQFGGVFDVIFQYVKVSLFSRFRDHQTGSLGVVGQRLHPRDPQGQLQEDDPETWHICRFPARRDADPDPRDLRTHEGDLLDPVRFPDKVVSRQERELGPADASAQLGQAPCGRDGGLVKEAWIHHYDGPKPREAYDRIGLYFDPSFGSLRKTADPACGMVIGRRGPDFDILDLWMQVADLPAQLAALATLVARWQPHEKVCELKAAGQSIYDIMRKQDPGWVGFTPTDSKEQRFAAVTTYFEAGNVHWPKAAPWLSEAVSQVLMFPRAKHDEVPDCLSMGLSRLADSSVSDLSKAMENFRRMQGNGPIGAMGMSWLSGFRIR